MNISDEKKKEREPKEKQTSGKTKEVVLKKEKTDIKKNGFALEIIEFYKANLGDAERSIRKLAEIQKNHPKEYKELSEFQRDPEKILDLTTDMDDETKGILFEMFIKQSSLTKRLSKLIELSVEEQEKLAEDIKTFGAKMEESINKLKAKKEAENE